MFSFWGRKRGLAIALLAAAAVLFGCCVRFLFATRTMTASEPGSYEISVVYGTNAGIPLGSSLSVTELTGERYWEYYRRTRAAVGEIDAMRAFDIRCLAPDGTVIEPAEPVRVRFRLEPDGPAGDSARVVHFGERTEALPVFLLGAASRPEYAVLSVRTSSFSVYTVVSTVLKQTLTASDGNEYLVTVTYDNTSGIPEDAELYVSEIKEGEAGYEEYVAQSAAALGEKPENLAFARAFDITLKNPRTGEEYQPNKDVTVTIELLKDDLNSYASVDVIHIPDGVGVEAQVMDTTVHGESVEFETSGFSVYVLTGVYTYTYIFYAPNGPVTETVTETGFTVSNWSSVYNQLSVQTDTGKASSQTVKNGETPVIPQLPDTEDKVFAGWFEGTHSGSDVSFGKSPYSFDNVEITENKTIHLYARYSTFAEVVFHDQYNGALGNYPVMYTRRGELVNGSASVQIDNVSATYSGSGNLSFYGWSETPVQVPGTSGTLVSTEDGHITVTGHKDLYPIFQPFHWLSFYSAYTGSGAEFVPQSAYFENDNTDWATSLPVPAWEGHTFLGWFNGDLTTTDNGDGTTTDTVTYSTQITNGDGEFIPGVHGTGVELQGGKLKVTADTTLYAKWSDASVSYKIIIWKQKTTDAAGLSDSNKTYDFVESVIKSTTTGSTVFVDEEYKTEDYAGFAFSRCDNAVTVNPSGYTVLNVYYDRSSEDPYTSTASHVLTFQDSVTGSGFSTSLPVIYENDSAVVYGTELLTGNNGGSFVPTDPTSGRKSFSFDGWYADANCSTRVFFDRASYNAYRYSKVLYETMPDNDLTIYAGWSADWYIVQIDPNYGTFNGSGGTWFWETIDGDLIREYTQVTRDYVPSSSGTYYYAKHDRAYYGYSGNEWDNSEPDRDAFYTKDPSKGTEDTTFEYAPGVYTYAGWYEVHADGTETLYDFSQHVDHDIVLRLHWKKAGVYYISYNPVVKQGNQTLTGTISGSQDMAAYADQAEVLITCGATAPAGYTFEGWKVRGDNSGQIYRVGQNFILNADNAVTVSGKSTVYLDAVYTKAGTAKIVYDPNGGTLTGTAETIDFGAPTDSTAPTPTKSIADGKAAISNLVNNSEFTLSDGKLSDDSDFAFKRQDEAGNAMVLAGWSTKANYKPGDPFYELGGNYGVDSEEPTTLYAVWKVTVAYHLNTESTTATWGGDWADYTWDETEKTYSQDVYLNNTVTEPSYIPTDSNGRIFLYWTEVSDGTTAYSFSAPVEKNLELYAAWGSRKVAAHAVDASAAALAEKTANDGWTINEIAVGAAGTDLTATSHVTPPSSDYVFAFAAVGSSLDVVSEENAVTRVTYNTTEKQVYVTYTSGGTAPLGDNDIYFVFYQTRALNIVYKSMVAVGATSGALEDVTMADGNTAPFITGNLGAYNMKDGITQPKGWVSDSALTHYSFALGKKDSENAGDLYVLTTASDSEDNRPSLQIRNTWRGFQYSTDGNNWVNCGYAPVLYTVYYTQQPTIVTIKEQTVGTSAVMSEQFQFQVVVKQTETDNTDSANPVVTESNLFSGTYTLPDGSGNNIQSAILFYSNDGTKKTTQTITVTQTAKTGFATTVDAAGKGIVTESERKWTYTNSSTVESPSVTFTNTQSNVAVDVHVARIDTTTDTIVPDDAMRSTSYSVAINPGETKTFLTELPSATVFGGNTTVYAFGAVLYGTDDGIKVTPGSLEVASVSFAQVSGNHYELILKDSDGNDLGPLNGYQVYYLYYPMPQVRYVKLASDGDTFTAIRGSLDGMSDTDTITYGQNTLSMNGTTVAQGQRFSFPMTGFRITQDVGTNTFRMPPILDDGIYARYLSYKQLGAGNAENITSLAALGADHVSAGLTMHLRVRDNALEWSFDGEAWTAFSGTPTVYAIYEERGYDLQITKSVPIDVGTNPSFTIELRSTAITKSSYSIEGYTDDTITVTPASGSTPGTITLTVVDGTSVKLKGLGQGTYTVRETGNQNYNLTAKCGPLNGSLEDVTVTNSILSFSLDRERKLELTNTSKAICKITVNGTETPFYTLQSAMEYVVSNIPSKNATIQMLTDYLMPSVDKPVIPAGYNITLNTAETSGGNYNFDGGNSGTASGATITRAADNTSGSLLTSRGTLTIGNITLNGNNVEADSAMIVSSGTLNIGDGVLLEKAKNSSSADDASKKGGAICATAGTVTVASTIRNNSAVNGGAIYSEGSSVTITGALSGNSAVSGGAIYYNGTGTISISGSARLTGNNATENGGAIYATAGTIAVSGGSMTKNSATENGGAIYTGSGAVNVSAGTIGGAGDGNSAANGSAIFVNTGSATFSGGNITGNTATAGGAVGIGNASARLFFSGAASIIGNTMSGNASNIYLDKDTDQIVNASGLEDGASIGIYVPGETTEDLFKNRGEPGAKFGIYTDATGITAFENDRLSGITVTADTASRRLVWGKSIQLSVYYLERFGSGFPGKTEGTWRGGNPKYTSNAYYLPANNNAASSIADDIRNKSLYAPATATFATAFVDDGSDAISYDDYITDVDWDSSTSAWKFTKRDGTTVSGETLVIYFAEPAYVNIENNTSFSLTISDLEILGCHVVNSAAQTGYGYGYVYAINGAVQDTLKPIKDIDLTLGAGKSIKLLFPGGKNQTYTLSGGFAVGSDGTEIPVRQTGIAGTTLSGADRTDFTLSAGKTGNTNGSTVDVIFGGEKPVCKIVTDATITDQEGVVATDPETSGTAYVFAFLKDAAAFVKNNSLTEATIEVLTDYLIPGSDLVSVPAGLNLTFVTAIGDTSEDYNYSDDTSARATISRNSDNSDSFIVVTDGQYNTRLSVKNLVFDGKNFSGRIAGGVIKTKDCEVEINNCVFQNCIANDGGGIKVEFEPDAVNYNSATLTVINSNFINCKSEGSLRRGGGAIWTNACNFALTGKKDTNGNYISGVFDSCIANDQGGAVFHRIDWMYPEVYRKNSRTTITACKFINCQAKAAGGLELDSYDIEVSDCWIENCQAFNRNAGGFNAYIQYKPNNNPNEGDDANPPVSATGETELTLNRCVIKDCTANQAGGGFRTLTHKTTLVDCTFTNNTAGNSYYGGGIAITNTNATEAVIKGCTIQNCSAQNGGGIFFDGSKNPNANLSIEDNPDSSRDSIISGNTVTKQGGGVYTNSATTLINTKIQNNTTTNNTVDNAAGMYINSKTLTIGKTGAEKDTTIITGNTASGGVASNLHMWGGNNANSIVVYCDLSVGSHIGVTNPGSVTQQFGTSPNSTTSPLWRPYGLADPTPDDPDYYPTFVADDKSVYGIIDRSDQSGMRIVWSGPPVCKITDAGGNLLYLDGARKYPAIFDALEGGTAGNWTSAFSVLGVANPTLYDTSGNPYTTKIYKVQMLIEEYQLGNTVTTFTVPNNGTALNITLTTASTSDGSYPYRGTPGSVTTIVRKSGNNKSMFSVGTKLSFTNIVLDGGNTKGLSSTANGSVLSITGSRYSFAVLGEGSIIKDSTTTGNGTVYVDWGDFTLAGGTVENCTAKNGGAVYMKSRRQTTTPDRGYFRFIGGTIQNCTATESGGGIYVDTGAFNMAGGKIQNCTAGQNGGGICFMANGQTPTTNEFTLSDGAIVSNCKADAGGGVYVNGRKTMKMESAFIMGNEATSKGGGIAIGGDNVTLIFSRTPWVSGNTRTGSLADGNACNLELDSYADTVIQTDGIWNGARIGVYVPGNRDDDAPGNDTNPYKDHGGEGDRFGTFNNLADASYLYGFVNDRNGLKGGLQSGSDPASYKGIHWIKIFSLEVSKTVDSYQDDSAEEFAFRVQLTGVASDGTYAEDINSSVAEPEKYGGLYFVNGVATQMVVSNGTTSEVVPLRLKAGESVTGERLPAGLNYTVEELLTDEQRAVYSAMPDEKIYGYVGEHAESTTRNRYLSTAEFTNLRPVCKITNNSGSILYQKTTIEYNWNESGSFTIKSYDHYIPAVYSTLEEAISVINNGIPKLYFVGSSSGSYLEFADSSCHVEMLTNYTMTEEETISSGKTVTLKTASSSAAQFPYRGVGNAVISRGDFDSVSMFNVNGGLILANIVLDGAKSTRSGVTANGGIVYVPADGLLTVQSGAILRNSTTTGNGGAIYVAKNGTMTMTGGVINLNAVTGPGVGAGVYLEEDAVLHISGNPGFGGTGVYNDGSLNLTTGNIKAGTNRQDIYIAGYASTSDEDTSAASLVIDGNITSGDGTIWVWAAESPRYKTLRQFAKYEDGVTNTAASLAAFRNARPDNETGADQVGRYLYGITKSDDTGKNVFWYGLSGYDVKFKKIDGFGNALEGAVFSLYTNPACTDTVKVSGTAVTGTSDSTGVVIFNNRVPIGVYYMKETTIPNGYANTNTYIVLVGDKALAKDDLDATATGYLTDIGTETITGQTVLYKTAYQDTESDYDKYAVFLIDSTTSRAVTTPDIAKYGVMNISTAERKAILRKVSNTYTPLDGAGFEILRYDHTLVSGTDINGATTTSFTSGVSGVYFIDMLPFGTYYLHETTIPSGYQVVTAGNDGNWFILTVNENGVGYQATDMGTVIGNTLNPVAKKPN